MEKQEIHRIVPKLIKYNDLIAQIRAKQKEKKVLLAKKKDMSFFQTFELIKVNALIVEATEALEELKSEKEQVMSSLGKYDVKGMQDVKAWIDGREKEIQKTKTSEAKYSAELDKALNEYHNLEVRAEELEPEELQAARLSLRPEEEQRAVSALENAYGASYDPAATRDAKNKVADLLDREHNDAASPFFRENLRQKQKEAQPHEIPLRKKPRYLER